MFLFIAGLKKCWTGVRHSNTSYVLIHRKRKLYGRDKKIIQIHPMFLFIIEELEDAELAQDSNTSYVLIHHRCLILCLKVYVIQIHPMFLFIPVLYTAKNVGHWIQIHPMFLFIRTFTGKTGVGNGIQIHPMFLFILYGRALFNTVEEFKYILCSYSSCLHSSNCLQYLYSNTSYVLIHPTYSRHFTYLL